MKRFQTVIDLSETPDDNEEGEEEIKPWPWANWTTIDWLLGLATILYIAGGAYISYVIYLLSTGAFDNCK